MKNLTIYTLILILIDQIIKYFVDLKMALNSSIELIKDTLNLTYVRNTGAAFSILEDNRILLIIIGVGALIAMLYYLSKKTLRKVDYISYSLLIAGIVGNLLDRILHGYVIDYIDIKLFNFPIFNFADTIIIIGAVVLLLSSIKSEKHEIQNKWWIS